MENYSLDYTPPQMIKHKRKRDCFNIRISSMLDLPSECVSKFTAATFEEDYSSPLCLEKSKLSSNMPPSENNENFELSQECSALKEEIDEISNELEFFVRNNRKQRMIKLMERIAESIDDSLVDIDELMDYHLLGNKASNIEHAYLDAQKKKKFVNDRKLCDFTNKLLMNDDMEIINKKSSQDYTDEKDN